jgi:RNA polymerase II subunit A small phosphatase-like protein
LANSTTANLTVATSLSAPGDTGDVEVIQPPTPTRQLLPEDDTLGVTSGAVTPPGATAAEAKRVHHQEDHRASVSLDSTADSSDDVEEAEESIPEDEDENEEEARLIASGGAGIPVGPVRKESS